MAKLRYLSTLLMLFWSLGAWALSAAFGPVWESGKPLPTDVAGQFRTLLGTQSHYLELLDEEDGFNGLYFRLEEEKGVLDGGNRLRYGLDWELYSNGRYESQKRQRRKRLNSLVQYWQLYSDMWHRLVDERRFRLQKLRDRLERRWLEDRRDLLQRQLQLADAELKAGFMLTGEHDLYRERLESTRLRLRATGDKRAVAMPAGWRSILNRIGEWELPPSGLLLKEALRDHPGLKLQALFSERANFHPEWRDDLETRIYLQNEQTDGRGTDGWQVGFRVRLPLDRPANRDETIAMEQGNYQLQAEALGKRLGQRLAEVAGQFRRHQAILKGQLERLQRIDRGIRRAAKHAKQAIAALRHTPANSVREMERERLDLEHDILLERLQALEYLLTLSELTGKPELDRLSANAGG